MFGFGRRKPLTAAESAPEDVVVPTRHLALFRPDGSAGELRRGRRIRRDDPVVVAYWRRHPDAFRSLTPEEIAKDERRAASAAERMALFTAGRR